MSTLYSVLKKPFFGQYQKPWSWPESVPPGTWQRVEFKNRSGAKLVGLFAAARQKPARAVVVLPHPMVAEAKAWGLKSGHADLLLDGGYDVFTFDFNGFGESENGRFEFPGDIHAAGLEARELRPELPVVLFGISMGAGYGICAMDEEDSPYTIAVIESAFTSLDEYWKKYPGRDLILSGRFFVRGKAPAAHLRVSADTGQSL